MHKSLDLVSDRQRPLRLRDFGGQPRAEFASGRSEGVIVSPLCIRLGHRSKPDHMHVQFD